VTVETFVMLQINDETMLSSLLIK